MASGFLPLVSVVIPVFNSEKTIEKCLDTVKCQTYPNLEVIVVDDGSSDETLTRVSKYNPIIIRNEQNLGAPHAMNVGAEKAQGEYVFFLDADAWAPNWLIEKAVSLISEDKSYSAVGGWYVPIGGDKLYSLYLRTIMFDRISQDTRIQVYSGKTDPQVFGCFLGFRRSVLSREEFSENFKAIYDREYMARLSRKGYKVLFCMDLFVFHPVPSTLNQAIQSLRVQSMWLGVVGKQYPIIIKYHLALLSALTGVLVLSFIVSPLILPFSIIIYALAQLYHFQKMRKRFSITAFKLLSLVGLTLVLTATVLFGFIVGLFMKPKSHWK